jgi:hypothetical protein
LLLRRVKRWAVEPSGNLPNSVFSRRFMGDLSAALAPADAQSITLAMRTVNPARPKRFILGNIGQPV